MGFTLQFCVLAIPDEYYSHLICIFNSIEFVVELKVLYLLWVQMSTYISFVFATLTAPKVKLYCWDYLNIRKYVKKIVSTIIV